jgi:Protein of unknown function (DUF2934)
MGTPSGIRSPELEEAIRRRAETFYEERGKVPGHEVEDWLRAEAEVTQEIAGPAKPAFVVVRVKGTTYTGEYDSHRFCGYAPGEFRPGAPVEVRFQGNHMFVKRANGEELTTKIVKKTAEE